MFDSVSVDSREGQLYDFCRNYDSHFNNGQSGDQGPAEPHKKKARKHPFNPSTLSQFFWYSEEDEMESAPPDMKRKWKRLNKMRNSGTASKEGHAAEVPEKTETKWHDLPMELLVRILALVDNRTVIVASGVCSGWRYSVGMGIHDLSFSWCGNGVSRLVQSVAPRFPNLQCCKLRRCVLDDTAIEAAARNWHGLKALDLTFGTQLTDACLRALAEGCPLLEKLDLSGCTGITQAGLVILAQHCNSLRHLNLCGCDSGGTDTALQALAQHCRGLQSLSLGWCEHITDKGVIALTQGCPDLRVVDLCGCSLITDLSVKALSDNCPQLCALGLHCCRLVTDDAMYTLARNGKRSDHKFSKHGMTSKKGGLRNSDGSLGAAFPVHRYYTNSTTSSCSSSGSTCSSDATKLPVMRKEGLDVLLGEKYNRHGLVSLNLSGCTSLSAQAVQAVCNAFPELHTCPERTSLITSGCSKLATVHCICIIEARRERSNRERRAGLAAVRHFPV